MQPVNFLLVRKAQLFREIKALGFLYSAIVAGATFLLLAFFLKSQVSIQNAGISGVVLTFVIAMIHFSRKDHRFIELVTEWPFLIYFIEYCTLATPFVLLSCIALGNPFFMLILFPVAGISFLKVASRPVVNFNTSSKLISETNFEWKAGMRKTGGLLGILWLAAMALTVVPFASIIALWFMLLVISSFYDEGEPREMVESYQLDAVKFLKVKILSQLKAFFIPALPVLLLFLYFFPERWWVMILFMVFSALNIGVFVLSKYAVWRSAEINRSGNIVNAMCLLGLFLPFFLPLPIAVIIKNYRRSLHNLKPLLHDYH